ncbi:glycoside hydrolase family 19 protein [Erwinia oleae]|uniref:glycoside hydrolase family 19 protein n=1 Tax=Erwinia oleae TaxID=796334 RepID=UPI000553CDC5|nr:glycoside hydrolase family 19 protein [Erwinia oleae]
MNLLNFAEAARLNHSLSNRWYRPLDRAMQEFFISTPQDQAMFLAQVGHESSGFTRLIESFNYSVAGLSEFVRSGRITQKQANRLGRHSDEPALPFKRQQAIANTVYADRYGNNELMDGWNYRGRGLIQITFKDNYHHCGDALDIDLVHHPDLLEQDEAAARSAAWYFTSHGCLDYSGDITRITQIINGGLNGIDERICRYSKALEILA